MEAHTKGKTRFCNDEGGGLFGPMQILPLLQVMTNLKSLMERLFPFHHDYSILTIFSKCSLFLHVHVFTHGHSRSHLCKLHRKKEKGKKKNLFTCAIVKCITFLCFLKIVVSLLLEQGVCHIVALPFTLKNILMQKKNYGNSNISPCKNIIFKKSSKTNQNPSRYYDSITDLKFQHKPKYHLSKILI